MPKRPHLVPRPVVDDAGNLNRNATIRVLKPGTTTPIAGPIYRAATGTATRAQGWSPGGAFEFWLDHEQTVRLGITIGGVETYIDDVDVGAVIRDRRSIRDYGAKVDGVTDDSAAIQAGIDELTINSSLHFPDGVCGIGSLLQSPTVDSCSLVADGPSSHGRPGPSVLRALPGANLPAIMGPQEWITNGAFGGGVALGKDAQGFVIDGLSFDGGGFNAGTQHQTSIETTANTNHGLVMHGNHWRLLNVFVVSANGHGVYVPQLGINGTSVIGESHENGIEGGGCQYTGGDSLHVAPYQQDSWMTEWRPQYAGGHCIFTDDHTAGWSFVHNHPSWAAKDIFHLQSGWECEVSHNYIGSIGEYMDGTHGAGFKRYGIYSEGPVGIADNRMNLNTGGNQSDPVYGIHIQGGPVTCHDNKLIYQASDNFVQMVEQQNLDAASAVRDNIAFIAGLP